MSRAFAAARWMAVVPLTLGLPACGGGGSAPSSATTPAPSATATPPPPSGTVLLADGFDTADWTQRWTTGTSCETNTIVVVGGRVRSTANCNFIQTRASFAGNLQVEVEVEKQGSHNHGCWDFYVELSPPGTAGVIRFDTAGRDGVNVGALGTTLCGDAVTGPQEGSNFGRAVFTSVDGQARFSFTGDDGGRLDVGPVSVPRYDRTQVRIHLAAHDDAPRFVDNVLIAVP